MALKVLVKIKLSYVWHLADCLAEGQYSMFNDSNYTGLIKIILFVQPITELIKNIDTESVYWF